jgi:synaptobrevin family protein YKT6
LTCPLNLNCWLIHLSFIGAPPFLIYAFARVEGICGIVIADKEYPEIAAKGLLRKICDEFVSKYDRSAYKNLTAPPKPTGMFASMTHDDTQTPDLLAYPELEDYIKRYQEPEQADNMVKIQKELDDTTKVLHKTIESVLERGQKIDELVAKSDELSSSSKMFYTTVGYSRSRCPNTRDCADQFYHRRRSRIPAVLSCE